MVNVYVRERVCLCKGGGWGGHVRPLRAQTDEGQETEKYNYVLTQPCRTTDPFITQACIIVRHTLAHKHTQFTRFNFLLAALRPPSFMSPDAKYKPLSLSTYPWSFISPCSPSPAATLPSFSPLCPIMDFSCDARKKYLLPECIDRFNGRAQRAKREERERGDWRCRRVRTRVH